MAVLEKDMPYVEMQAAYAKGIRCGDCGGVLNIAWGGGTELKYDGYILRCSKDINHSVIERPQSFSAYDTPGFNLTHLRGRTEQMEKTLGKEKAHALMKYQQSGALTKAEATEIIKTCWPDAPEVEVYKAAMICKDFGLNPLMQHVYLIPFKSKTTGRTTWAVVIGIKASRLMVAREKKYGYIDGTPRIMTIEEQNTTFGEVDTKNIVCITILQSGGQRYPGYGRYPKDKTPLGVDKGNSKFNMASIRSERQALDRLSPGTLPTGVEVGDERYVDIEAVSSEPIETASGPVDKATGEILDGDTVESTAVEVPASEDQDSIFPDDIPSEPPVETKTKSKREPPKRNERVITAVEVAKLQAALPVHGFTRGDVGIFIDRQRWGKLGNLSELKHWQYSEVMSAIEFGKLKEE